MQRKEKFYAQGPTDGMYESGDGENAYTSAPMPEPLTKAMALEDAETALAEAQDSESVQKKFRRELVPLAFGVYKLQMLSEDPKIAKAAADSVMKIEGSLGGTPQLQSAGGVTLNFNVRELGNALQKIASGDVIEGAYE